MINSLLSGRWLPVWQRNFYVWLKLMVPALLANFVEPLLYLLALGYGLGSFVGTIGGIPYIAFLAGGMICASVLNTATFEILYSGYTRLAMQQTWSGMLATPLAVEDIVLGEVAWAASKALISAVSILIVAFFLGTVNHWQAIWVIPLMLLAGLCFASMGLIITALSKGYDFFMYYIILFTTPMVLLSGVFFPLSDLPPFAKTAAFCLPLAPIVELTRAFLNGQTAHSPVLGISVIIIYTAVALIIANYLLNKRLCE